MNEWLPLIGMFVTVTALLFGFFKWFTDWVEKRNDEYDKRINERLIRMTARLDDHKSEFEKLHQRMDKQEHESRKHQESVNDRFVRRDEVGQIRQEMREDFNSIFTRMEAIEEALNRLIGRFMGNNHE